MSYNNYNGGGYGGRGGNNYGGGNYGGRGNYNGGHNGRSNNNGGQPRKRSGAKTGFCRGEADRPFVRGWNASRRFGLVTFLCTPYKKTDEHKSGSGRIWQNWMCTITRPMAKPEIVSCLFDQSTGKVTIPSLSMVVNPKAPNGGYCGTFIQSKTRR